MARSAPPLGSPAMGRRSGPGQEHVPASARQGGADQSRGVSDKSKLRRSRAERMSVRRTELLLAVVAIGLGACGSGDSPAPSTSRALSISLSFTGLRALDAATEGIYEAWIVDGAGAY